MWSTNDQNKRKPDDRSIQDSPLSPQITKYQKNLLTSPQQSTPIPRPLEPDFQSFLAAANQSGASYIRPDLMDLETNDQAAEQYLNTLKNKDVRDMLKGIFFESQEELQVRVHKVEQTTSLHSTQLTVVQERLDTCEQANRQKMLIIDGIKEVANENLVEGMIQFANHPLQVQLRPLDIDFVRRMGKVENEKTRPILICFISLRARQEVYAARMQLAKLKREVYIREFLTPIRSSLMFEARRMKREGKIFGHWSQDGEIKVIIKRGDPPQTVKSSAHLNSLLPLSLLPVQQPLNESREKTRYF